MKKTPNKVLANRIQEHTKTFIQVGRFKMFSLKFKNFDFHENFIRYAIIAATVLFVVLYGIAGLAWSILLYFLLSMLRQRRIGAE